ncbi:MAG: hypothetical protein KY475_18390 [Planctomycetes bacterium]|nr:hypothetical protein [Planctomycetota bacterium]
MDPTHAAYRRLKPSIDQDHPQGWFVAIADDRVIGATADFHDLENALRNQSKDPQRILIVEAGADYPEDVTIFGSDQVFQAPQASSPDFKGLAGLPLLRVLEYGGDHVAFWLRKLHVNP